MTPADLRLQMGLDSEVGERCHGKLRYRFARDNGWSCGHWHASAEAATECLTERLATKEAA